MAEPAPDRVSHIIIVGAAKTGTTSLFSYLAQHSGVRQTWHKELDFFSTGVEALPPPRRGPEIAAAYAGCFPADGAAKVGLDASVSYFWHPESASRIAEAGISPLIVIVARDPIERLRSHFWHMHRLSAVPESMDFDAFLTIQSPEAGGWTVEGCWRNSAYGAQYERFATAVGAERVAVVYTDDLAVDPRPEVKRILTLAGLDPGAADAFDFERRNAKIDVRWPRIHKVYHTIIETMVSRTARHPRLYRTLRSCKRWLVDPLYLGLAVRPEQPDPAPSPAAIPLWLAAALADDRAVLERHAGPVPWPTPVPALAGERRSA